MANPLHGGRGKGTHLVDPVDVGRHAGEDCRLLDHVAFQARTEADDAFHLPDAILTLAVQGAARITLCGDTVWAMGPGQHTPHATQHPPLSQTGRKII